MLVDEAGEISRNLRNVNYVDGQFGISTRRIPIAHIHYIQIYIYIYTYIYIYIYIYGDIDIDIDIDIR